MRISISKACVGLTFLCMTPTTGFAEEKSYVCAINEVYECVTVTGCSRVSLADANVAGIMVLDMEKKQLRSAPLGGEPRVDDIEGLSVTNKAILIYGTGKRETDRTVSALISLETGNLTAGISTLGSGSIFHCPRRPTPTLVASLSEIAFTGRCVAEDGFFHCGDLRSVCGEERLFAPCRGDNGTLRVR